VTDEKLNFQDFAIAVRVKKLDLAGQILSILFDITDEEGLGYAKHFSTQINSNPNFMAKAMSLRAAVTTNEPNNALLLIIECFGASGPMALKIFEKLKKL
jgi:hypothetical protein